MTILNQGDVAVIGYQQDAPDAFSVVFLTDVDTSHAINFTEMSWTDGNSFYLGEGNIAWTPPSSLTAGDVVTFVENQSVLEARFNVFINGVSSGTVQASRPDGSGDFWSTSGAGDQLFVYQGTPASPNLIWGADMDDTDPAWTGTAAGTGGTSSTRPQASDLDLSFSPGYSNLNGTNDGDNFIYSGITSGTVAALQAAIANPANWTVATNSFNTSETAETFGFSSFTVTAPGAAPTIDTNTGSTLNEGALDVIVASELETNDADTADSALVYTVTTSSVANGTLWVDSDGSGTVNNAEAAIGVGGTFTQADIAAGLVKYQHDGGETTSDGFGFQVSDGATILTGNSFAFSVTPVSDAPVIANVNGDVIAYFEGFTTTNVDLSANATVTDVDNATFNGGSLTVSMSAGGQSEDDLTIANVGFGAGQTGLLGNLVFSDGVNIGTFTGGTGGTTLSVALNGAATAANTQLLIRNILYQNQGGDDPNTTQRTVSIVLNDGATDSSTQNVTINITAFDDPAVAEDDSFATGELTALSGESVFVANGGSADADPDSALVVTQVNGAGGNVGTQFALASGALVTLTAAGALSYDPNGAFEYLALGATAVDSFTYQLNGGDTATVSVTVSGVDNNDVFDGTADTGAFDGGTGLNTVTYAGSATGVVFDVDTPGNNTGDAVGDSITNVQRIYGSAQNDTITGGAGLDIIRGGAGADSLDGGGGLSDILDYSDSSAAVSVDLGTDAVSGGDAAGDVIANFERAIGGDFDDTLTGNSGDNLLIGGDGADTLLGLGGRDVLRGSAGADSLDGGAGDFDMVDYRGSAAVSVNLATNTVSGGDATGDVIVNFERVFGGSGNDVLTGNSGANLLIGWDGDDTLDGGDGNDVLRGGIGADSLDGGAGDFDVVEYRSSVGAVTVNLATNTVSGGDAAGDTIVNFERAFGGLGDDVLTGSSGNNLLAGWDGNDTLDGGIGSDVLRGGAGADVMDGGAGNFDMVDYRGSTVGVTVNLATNTVSGGDATGDSITGFERARGSDQGDSLTGTATGNLLVGEGGNDTIDGGDGNDRVRGGAGADSLDGGAGNYDILDYQGSSAAVTVDIGANTATGGDATGDVIVNFEQIFGSHNDDMLTGNSIGNVLSGGDGADTLTGGVGNDTLRGGGVDGDIDQFVFRDGDLRDTITDFELGIDKIVIDGAANAIGDLTFGESGGNATINYDNGDFITLIGITELQANDVNNFLFI